MKGIKIIVKFYCRLMKSGMYHIGNLQAGPIMVFPALPWRC